MCVANNAEELSAAFTDGDIAVVREVTKDMVPILKKAGGIISEEIGEANNAGVLAMALDIPVITGAIGATRTLKSGTAVTMDAGNGHVYSGTENIDADR